MPQYKVPQNVQREDTIIGSLTLKQMIILGIGGGIAYAIYVTLARTYFIEVWLPPVAIVVVITLAFTFIKIHDLTFNVYLMSLLEYRLLPQKRVWIQGADTPFSSSLMQKREKKDKKLGKEIKKETKSLKELTEILDTGGEVASKEEKKEELQKIINQNYKK